jgi:hypothetical protein
LQADIKENEKEKKKLWEGMEAAIGTVSKLLNWFKKESGYQVSEMIFKQRDGKRFSAMLAYLVFEPHC